MRRLVRILVAAAFVALILVATGTLVPRPFFEQRAGVAAEAPGARRVLLLANPIHTDIALPADPDVVARFEALGDADFPVDDANVRWLVFGWGGRAFYLETPTWSELKPLPVLRALTLDRSVMHVEIAGDIPLDHPAVTSLLLDGRGFSDLLDFIEASFERNASGMHDEIEGRGYGAQDRFYEANGSFNAFAGCNVWTAAALRAAGLRTGWWTPLPQLLKQSIELYDRDQIEVAGRSASAGKSQP